jgi:hydrogenase/urease accessory protein HupE
MGGSRWSFSKNAIRGFIELKSPVISEIKPIKEGHYDLASASDERLQRIASDVLQPYVDKKLSITVNDKRYPVKVDRIVRTSEDVYTICLSVPYVDFSKPVNNVKIVYALLFEETNNQHVNLAFGYVSDDTGEALQHVFEVSRPQFQTTFDSQDTTWQVAVNGAAIAPTAEQKTASLVAEGNLENTKNPVTQKSAASNLPASVLTPQDVAHRRNTDENSTVSSSPSMGETSSDGKGNESDSQNTVSRSIWATLLQFVPLGIEHILTGYDHIAFLLAIVVIELSIKEILKIITAFTVAHSITLLLAALDIVRLNSALVESLIALSICYVALENIFKKKATYRWLIAFGFGLIHGFGFASALRGLIVGKANLLLSVLCFNIGVEMGQLMLLFALLPILYLLKKLIGFRIVTVGASVGIFVIGLTWLMERVFHLELL